MQTCPYLTYKHGELILSSLAEHRLEEPREEVGWDSSLFPPSSPLQLSGEEGEGGPNCVSLLQDP